MIAKNLTVNVEMMKKSNFMSAQSKEDLPDSETVTIFTPEEIEKFKAEAFRAFKDGKRKYQQAAAYILMLNTGLRTEELLGLLNSNIDLERKTLTGRKRGLAAGRNRMHERKTNQPKSAAGKRTVPLNRTARSCDRKPISAKIRPLWPTGTAVTQSR